MKKYAAITMDVEDWYTNDYFLDCKGTDSNYHMLDGLDVLVGLLDKNSIPATFFALTEILPFVGNSLVEAEKNGSEVALHGLTHNRPLTMTLDEFKDQITKAKKLIEDCVGHEVFGYRAPTYAINDEHLDIIRNLGFKYDSSKVAHSLNPHYGTLNLPSFTEVQKNIWIDKAFCEFGISTEEFIGKRFPIGGGYIRMLPWSFNFHQLKKYTADGAFYIMYIHPFELSSKCVPKVRDASLTGKIRANVGRKGCDIKIQKIIDLLKSRGYEFVTLGSLRKKVLNGGH